jgi:uncharacterized protein YdeI (YjbR/CyaY-like superfamily)
MPHKIPTDLSSIFQKDKNLKNIWESLTPLAQNEWVCWIVSVKREETRELHLKRFEEELKKGKRRPCCWAGCPHR